MNPPDLPDVLSGLAPLLRVRPELESLCRFGAQWASRHDAEGDGWAPFHLVARGTCLLQLPDTAAVLLEAGDVAVLPHGGAHTVRGSTTPTDAVGTANLRHTHTGAIAVKTNGDGDAETELVCGRLKFEQAHQNLIFATLPSVVVVRTHQDADAVRLRQLMAAIRDELDAARPGAAAIAADLASALLVMILRSHFDREPVQQGLLGLLGQRQTARAVAAILEAPERDWGLDELASQAGASRATLVRSFQKTAGMAPLAFLAELRLGIARRKLLAGASSLAQIAAEVGYQSESAFSRAFQRRFGLRPGEARRAGGEDSPA
ncbi:MAG TPA: AraC family transcriptional regulator [Aliidongia sp.]|uniref:AraC family transcriptional regulator n=1 Tax=Aliidongia sp. TaxID=1914230 RepID=UPI002DDD8526|nr:AraC family transcriptional regulator [Aliidongia sp.]HEV2675532.1 AraC family transcriptional regulator [Aliidongia sp.]